MLRAASAAGWFGVYAAAVVWLTWPLAQHLGTHLPNTWVACRYDSLLIGWALAHQAHALVSAPWMLGDGNIFHPAPHALFYGEPGFGALPWFMPAYLLTDNPTLALNVTFLLSVALTAWALHLVVHAWTGSQAGGLVAGWTFLSTPWVLWKWVPSAPNYAVLQYCPFIVLLAALPGLTVRRFALLLSLVILQGLVTIYVAVPLLLVIGVIALVRLWQGNRDTALGLMALAGSAALALGVANVGFLLVRAENPTVLGETPWPLAGSTPMALPWDLFGDIAPTAVVPAVLLLIAGGSLAFAFEGHRRIEERRAWRHAALWSAIGLWASLTRHVTVFGHGLSIGWITLAGWLPVLREPPRLGVVGLIGLALLAGLAATALGRRLAAVSSSAVTRAWAPRIVALAAIAIVYRQYGSAVSAGGYPLAPAISVSSPLIDELRAGSGPLLELPAKVPEDHARAMYRSIYHGRPILNGYDGYWPAGFRERMAVAERLPDPAALADLRRQTGLASVLVHAGEFGRSEREFCDQLGPSQHPKAVAFCAKDHGGTDRDTWLALAAANDRTDLPLVARQGLDLLFAVEPR